MKLKTSILFLLFLVLLTACHKEPLDYRNKYLGDYSFSVIHSYHSPGNNLDTTYVDVGKIDYGSDPQSVTITLSGGMVVDCIVYEDGTLEGNIWAGEFETSKKCMLQYIDNGLGTQVYYKLAGEKK